MERLEGLDAVSLLPPHLHGVDVGGRPRLRDVWPLPGGVLLSVHEAANEVLVAPMVSVSSGARRALPGEGAYEAILGAIREGARSGAFRADRFAEVPPAEGEARIEVDQSNDSVVVGDVAVVKLYPRTAPGPQPGLDLPAHLAAVGFTDIPRPFGAVVWDDPSGRPTMLASASGYLAGARDGWEWWLDLLLGALDGAIAWERSERPAEAVGSLVARLHVAASTGSDVVPDPVGRSDGAGWEAGARATVEHALALTPGAEGEKLRRAEAKAREAISHLSSVGPTTVIRIHGDLHVGQVLAWREGYAISDLDGNPLAPLQERVAMAPPARDVASMAMSIDHVGRIAQRRRPGRDAEVQGWIDRTRDRFLDAYRASLADRDWLFDERLLFPFEVAQECHEYVYAARYVPRWRYVPDLALPNLLGLDR